MPASRAALLASVQGSEAARRSSGGVVMPLRISSYGRSATTTHIASTLVSPYTDLFLRQECGGNPYPNPQLSTLTLTLTLTLLLTLTLRQEC